MGKLVEWILGAVDRFQKRHGILAFPLAVVKKYGDDRGGALSSLIAYNGFLALFPLLLVLVTVVGYLAHGHPGLRRSLVDSALSQFPVVGPELRNDLHPLGGNPLALALGVALLLWGARGFAQALQHAMAEVWNVPRDDRPGFLPRLARSGALIAILGLGVLLTTAATGTAVFRGSRVGPFAGLVAGVAINTGLFLLAFRTLTPSAPRWRELLPGAVVAGFGWTALQAAGSILVDRQLRHSSELYGFFALVLGLIWWIFLGAQLTVYAAELNVVRSRRLWPRGLFGPPSTDADLRVLETKADVVQRPTDAETPPSADDGPTGS